MKKNGMHRGGVKRDGGKGENASEEKISAYQFSKK
jgi:hypothetical protein